FNSILISSKKNIDFSLSGRCRNYHFGVFYALFQYSIFLIPQLSVKRLIYYRFNSEIENSIKDENIVLEAS
ncbi:MAG: hypothetical protein IKJ59_04565, partial [Clostridia bacterium]|nr:hypothetical protein [Clostridia bacterium]